LSQQQKSPHEDFIMTTVVFGLVIGISWVIWHFFSNELTNAVRWIRVTELYLVKFIYGDGAVLARGGQRYGVAGFLEFMKKARVGEISAEHVRVSTMLAVYPMRYFFIGGIALMALVLLFKGPNAHYRRRMGLEMLMREQAKSFPTIQPFLKFDPRKTPHRAPGSPVPANLPVFSEALSPEEWMAYHEVSYKNGQLDMNAAFHGLVEQLGNRWQGPLKLPVHAQGLYAVFALKHVRKRKESEQMLNDLALSWSDEKGFRPSSALKSRIRKVIKDPKQGGALQKFADQHAFETTALLRCLSRARDEGGVMAPAQFLWLRGHDRTLWYPLNNLGRKSFHAEAAGAMVHYTNELIAGQKIPTPRFEDVIRGMETYMKSGAGRPIPELDKSKGARKRKKR
jgi:intracellular multiplication protein IcmP